MSFSFPLPWYSKSLYKNERLTKRKIKERYVHRTIPLRDIITNTIKNMNQDYDLYERKLANEIADTLKDRDSITMHLQYVRKYKEEFLRRILNKVMALPDEKIRRSRAALYTFLINQSVSHGDARH